MIDAFIDRCRASASAIYCGEGRILATVLGRYRTFLDGADIGMTPNLACDGFWEPSISAVFERYVKPGMVTADIGANVGYYSLMMASQVGEAGKVIAVEASPVVAGLLADTIVINRLEKTITLHNVAAADKPGTLDFYLTPERNLNGCILLDEWRDKVDPAFVRKVPAMPVDDILDAEPRIDFIKVDVEGAEHLVWKGLARTLSRNPDIIVVLEYNFMRHSHAGDIVAMIEAAGFPLREIDADGAIRAVVRETLFDTAAVDDRMLFLKRGDSL